MKKQLARALTAATLAMGFAVAAQAVPIHIAFTGTNTGSAVMPDGSVIGQTVTGAFNFETDRLTRRVLPPSAVVFEDLAPTNLSDPLASLSFGGRDVTFPTYDAYNYGYIFFSDGCSGVDCTGDDLLGLFVSTAEQSPETIAAGFTGTYRSTSLNFVPFSDFIPRGDQFDVATVDPTDLVDVQMSTATLGIYSENLFSCVSGVCEGQMSRSFGFNLDSVSRSVGTHSVPEPGTAGLLGVACLMGLLFWRRRPAPQPVAA